MNGEKYYRLTGLFFLGCHVENGVYQVTPMAMLVQIDTAAAVTVEVPWVVSEDPGI